ncbi:hypothetical protein WBG99_23975 [Streptomyces sp. TG1A-60]|uniref:hypothetical protein n=1 Tax=Streptomyces sp. TG1A-60 TaxID=3129111 RepID=UPI0030CF81D5
MSLRETAVGDAAAPASSAVTPSASSAAPGHVSVGPLRHGPTTAARPMLRATGQAGIERTG